MRHSLQKQVTGPKSGKWVKQAPAGGAQRVDLAGRLFLTGAGHTSFSAQPSAPGKTVSTSRESFFGDHRTRREDERLSNFYNVP